MSDTHNFDLQELNLTFRNEFLRLYAFLSRLHNVVNKICEIIIHDKCDYRLLSIYDDRPIHTSSSKLFNTSLSPPDRKLASRGGPPEREKWEGDEIRSGEDGHSKSFKCACATTQQACQSAHTIYRSMSMCRIYNLEYKAHRCEMSQRNRALLRSPLCLICLYFVILL